MNKKAWILEYFDSSIVVFAESKEKAEELGKKNCLLECCERSDYNNCERAEEFDKYYDDFKESNIIYWGSLKSDKIYYENQWKQLDSETCGCCGKSEYDNIPESTLFCDCIDDDTDEDIDEDIDEHECNEYICYQCINDGNFKGDKQQKARFMELKIEIDNNKIKNKLKDGIHSSFKAKFEEFMKDRIKDTTLEGIRYKHISNKGFEFDAIPRACQVLYTEDEERLMEREIINVFEYYYLNKTERADFQYEKLKSIILFE